jgi:DNA-binding transcriptional LysR family regulator
VELNILDRLNLELLRTFSVAARAPSFAAASRVRGVTVSAISQQVKALEAQLGLDLFERLGRRVRLTPEARALALEVDTHLGHLEQALARVTRAHVSIEGLVTLGGPRTFGGHFVLPRLVRLLRARPALRVDLRFDVPSALERQLIDGALDLAIMGRPTEIAGLESAVLATETFVAIVAPSLRKALPPGLTEQALAEWPWLIFDEDLAMHAPWWRSSFGRRPKTPKSVVAAVGSLEQLQSLAEAGLGAAVLPRYLVEGAVAAGRLIQVTPVNPARAPRRATNTLFLAWRRGAPLTARVRAVRDSLYLSPVGETKRVQR